MHVVKVLGIDVHKRLVTSIARTFHFLLLLASKKVHHSKYCRMSSSDGFASVEMFQASSSTSIENTSPPNPSSKPSNPEACVTISSDMLRNGTSPHSTGAQLALQVCNASNNLTTSPDMPLIPVRRETSHVISRTPTPQPRASSKPSNLQVSSSSSSLSNSSTQPKRRQSQVSKKLTKAPNFRYMRFFFSPLSASYQIGSKTFVDRELLGNHKPL